MRNVLSDTEFYILQYLWSLETPTTFAEIMVHFTEEGKTWKKQTVPLPYDPKRIFKIR